MLWHKACINQFLANPGQNDATKYGVSIIPASVSPGQVYWRCIGVHHLSGSENAGKNNVFLDVLDEQAQRIGPPWPLIDWKWEGMRDNEQAGLVVLDKPAGEPGGNIALHASQVATVWVAGRTSDKITGLQTAGIDDPGEEPGNHRYHHSFYVVFQRTVKGGAVSPVEPPEEEEPSPAKDWLSHFDDRQRKQITFSRLYAKDFRHGATGHNDMLIIAKMAELLDGKEKG